MIINTGMRTDIPAFYSKWLLNRIDSGYVYVRNPYYPHQVTKYILDPKVVDCLLFCTKNPHPLIPFLPKLDKFKQYWFITITPYEADIEPNVPSKEKVINDFKILSKHLGITSISLRYDPIFITEKYNIDMHIKSFAYILGQLKGYTKDCTISFLDMYEKVKRNAPDLRPPTKEEQIILASSFYKIGKQNNITIHSCCENSYLKEYGLDITGCLSKEIIERSIKSKLDNYKRQSKRLACNCLMGNDIGMYNTCMHLCKYCYANSSTSLVKENIKKHNPNSPLLIGDLEEDDIVVLAKQQSWISKNYQLSLFDDE